MTFLFCPIPLSTFFKKLKCHVLWEAFLSHPLTLILVPLVPVALCIIFVKALMILTFVLLSSMADIILTQLCMAPQHVEQDSKNSMGGWMGWMGLVLVQALCV